MPEETKELFKYIPKRYVKRFFERGEILFRNLVSFQKMEGNRGDILEGIHRDNPDNDITIENLSNGYKWRGDASYLNSLYGEDEYVFCFSTKLDLILFEKFETDFCVRISDPETFEERLNTKIRTKQNLHENGLLSGLVKYYSCNRPAEFDIKSPSLLPFAKTTDFQEEAEFRFVWGKRKAFRTEQSIIHNELYDFREELMKRHSRQETVVIGSIKDIAEMIEKEDITSRSIQLR